MAGKDNTSMRLRNQWQDTKYLLRSHELKKKRLRHIYLTPESTNGKIQNILSTPDSANDSIRHINMTQQPITEYDTHYWSLNQPIRGYDTNIWHLNNRHTYSTPESTNERIQHINLTRNAQELIYFSFQPIIAHCDLVCLDIRRNWTTLPSASTKHRPMYLNHLQR